MSLPIKVSRPSVNAGEGYALFVDHPYYKKNQTLKAINKKFKKDISPNQEFIIELDNGVSFIGYCHKKRGDFYVKRDIWEEKMEYFPLPETRDFRIISVEV
jgi:hypothetical protein